VAAANAQNKSAEPGKHPQAPTKNKPPSTAVNSKGDHPKKPSGKEEKQDREKPDLRGR